MKQQCCILITLLVISIAIMVSGQSSYQSYDCTATDCFTMVCNVRVDRHVGVLKGTYGYLQYGVDVKPTQSKAVYYSVSIDKSWRGLSDPMLGTASPRGHGKSNVYNSLFHSFVQVVIDSNGILTGTSGNFTVNQDYSVWDAGVLLGYVIPGVTPEELDCCDSTIGGHCACNSFEFVIPDIEAQFEIKTEENCPRLTKALVPGAIIPAGTKAIGVCNGFDVLLREGQKIGKDCNIVRTFVYHNSAWLLTSYLPDEVSAYFRYEYENAWELFTTMALWTTGIVLGAVFVAVVLFFRSLGGLLKWVGEAGYEAINWGGWFCLLPVTAVLTIGKRATKGTNFEDQANKYLRTPTTMLTRSIALMSVVLLVFTVRGVNGCTTYISTTDGNTRYNCKAWDRISYKDGTGAKTTLDMSMEAKWVVNGESYTSFTSVETLDVTWYENLDLGCENMYGLNKYDKSTGGKVTDNTGAAQVIGTALSFLPGASLIGLIGRKPPTFTLNSKTFTACGVITAKDHGLVMNVMGPYYTMTVVANNKTYVLNELDQVVISGATITLPQVSKTNYPIVITSDKVVIQNSVLPGEAVAANLNSAGTIAKLISRHTCFRDCGIVVNTAGTAITAMIPPVDPDEVDPVLKKLVTSVLPPNTYNAGTSVLPYCRSYKREFSDVKINKASACVKKCIFGELTGKPKRGTDVLAPGGTNYGDFKLDLYRTRQVGGDNWHIDKEFESDRSPVHDAGGPCIVTFNNSFEGVDSKLCDREKTYQSSCNKELVLCSDPTFGFDMSFADIDMTCGSLYSRGLKLMSCMDEELQIYINCKKPDLDVDVYVTFPGKTASRKFNTLDTSSSLGFQMLASQTDQTCNYDSSKIKIRQYNSMVYLDVNSMSGNGTIMVLCSGDMTAAFELKCKDGDYLIGQAVDGIVRCKLRGSTVNIDLSAAVSFSMVKSDNQQITEIVTISNTPGTRVSVPLEVDGNCGDKGGVNKLTCELYNVLNPLLDFEPIKECQPYLKSGMFSIANLPSGLLKSILCVFVKIAENLLVLIAIFTGIVLTIWLVAKACSFVVWQLVKRGWANTHWLNNNKEVSEKDKESV